MEIRGDWTVVDIRCECGTKEHVEVRTEHLGGMLTVCLKAMLQHTMMQPLALDFDELKELLSQERRSDAVMHAISRSRMH